MSSHQLQRSSSLAITPQVAEIGRGFRVSHQKVSIDVNLADWSLEGWTEITIVPTNPALKQIILDCRECQIHGITVNSRKAQYYHNDIVNSVKLNAQSSVNQHHLYRQRIDDLMKETLPGELYIQLPKGFRITLQDQSSSQYSGEMGMYAPISVKIDFSLRNGSIGMNFVGGNNSNIKKVFWHAYTTHSPIGQSTSSWLPCVDGLWEACTWQLEISVPRTVGDIGKSQPIDLLGEVKKDNEDDVEMNDTLEVEEEAVEEMERDIVVVCDGSKFSEIAHPFDARKKVVSVDIFNLISSSHIGFAVGAFEKTSLSEIDATNEEPSEENDGSVPIYIYTFPYAVDDAINACMFLRHALDHFAKEYGSYPFSSFSLCFVNDAWNEVGSSVGLAICSDKLIFPAEAIEPLFTSTATLTIALASQWCGINIVPRTWNDLWITMAIPRFMTHCYERKLIGNNEYRFKLKKQTEEVCRQDIGKPPLGEPDLPFPLLESDLDFMKLKGPVVLFILDRRMTKTDRSLGLSRVLPKIFLQAMSGDLANGCLSTAHFIRLCERVGHNPLESFFEQWVFSSGYPIFRVTQRFNKKRMFVEMGIRQVQSSEMPNPYVNDRTFVQDAKSVSQKKYPTPPVFTGPMTIRIHEADGTPYEHVVEIKETFMKLDIQYNTKYKRLKRNKRNYNAAVNAPVKGEEVDYNGNADEEETGEVLLHSLGDILQTEEEMNEWKLTDWSMEEEDRMVNEAFEWIRVDTDFEWICIMYVNQPDYMYYSQLQQDRDVVAQYEAVRYFLRLRPSQLYSSILVRTLNDRRYYYGIRQEAALALVSCATEELRFIGMFHLLKTFQAMFCFANSTIPRANDFSDVANYFVQKSILKALSRIRNKYGECPLEIKKFLLDLLRYNENSSNDYTDCYYVCHVITCIVDSLVRIDNGELALTDFTEEAVNQTREFVLKAVDEIERCGRMDSWIPSIQNLISITAIQQKERLVREGYIAVKFEELMQYTKQSNNSDVRLAAFQSMLSLGGISDEHKAVMRYVFITCENDNSSYIRYSLLDVLQTVIGIIAIKGEVKNGAVAEKPIDGLMVLEDNQAATDSVNARRETIARMTIIGAVDMVRKTVGQYKHLRKELWNAVIDQNDKYNIVQKRLLLDVCQVLYPSIDSFIVTLPTPRAKKLIAKHLGQGKVVIKREGRLKIQIAPATNAGSKKSKKKAANGKIPNVSLKKDNVKVKLKLNL